MHYTRSASAIRGCDGKIDGGNKGQETEAEAEVDIHTHARAHMHLSACTRTVSAGDLLSALPVTMKRVRLLLLLLLLLCLLLSLLHLYLAQRKCITGP